MVLNPDRQKLTEDQKITDIQEQMNNGKDPLKSPDTACKDQKFIAQQGPAPIDAATAAFLRFRAEAAAQGRDPFARPRRAALASTVDMSRKPFYFSTREDQLPLTLIRSYRYHQLEPQRSPRKRQDQERDHAGDVVRFRSHAILEDTERGRFEYRPNPGPHEGGSGVERRSQETGFESGRRETNMETSRAYVDL